MVLVGAGHNPSGKSNENRIRQHLLYGRVKRLVGLHTAAEANHLDDGANPPIGVVKIKLPERLHLGAVELDRFRNLLVLSLPLRDDEVRALSIFTTNN